MKASLCPWHRQMYAALRHHSTHWTKADRRRYVTDTIRACLACQGRAEPDKHLGRDLP